jgi:3-hydroxyisobutyrate dehydrogenase
MLPSSEHVRAAYLGPHGILSLEPRQLHPHLLVDCSTIDPITAQEVAAAAADTSLHPHASDAHDGQQSPMMIDAPVSGGVPGAQAGSLTFMCGGPAAAVDAARPLLEVMGKRVIYCEFVVVQRLSKAPLAASMWRQWGCLWPLSAVWLPLAAHPRLLSLLQHRGQAGCRWACPMH